MSKKNQLRVKFAFKEGIKVSEFPPSIRKKIEFAFHDFIIQLSEYCASRAVAFPEAVEINFGGGHSLVFSRPKSKVQTRRQKEILRASGMPMLLDFLERCARDETGRARMKERKAAYEKACFGKLRSSGKKRAAFEFLRRLRLSRDYDRESTDSRVMSQILPIEMLYLSPLLEALNALDAEFFDGLAEAMRILQSYGKDPTNKWLIEHEEEIKGCTPEEIIKRFGSQFQVISSDKLHRRLNKLGLDHEHGYKPRGKASPKYAVDSK